MMRKSWCMSAVLCLAVIMSGTIMGSFAFAKDTSAIKKVAVVSFSVSDVAGTVRAGSVGTSSVAGLMKSKVNGMLAEAEKKLGRKWTVVKASSFITNAAYRGQSVENKLTVFLPTVGGKVMPVFTQVGKEIKGGQIDPDKAKAICKALGVDGIVLIFSEWSAKTGSMVPTTKAITKNVLTVWDRNGTMVFKKRVDMVGKKTLGAGGIKAVNDQSIGEWTDAYERALDKIIDSI